MKQYVCSVCSYTYDEAKGIPEAGVAPGTPWEDLPPDWKCPWCGAGKDAFSPKETPDTRQAAAAPLSIEAFSHSEREMSPLEMSVLCSNLARGCEKQYLAPQAQAFQELAEFFRQQAQPPEDPSLDRLLELIGRDLSTGFPQGKATAAADRGALRCQVWAEKVTLMLNSLLTRYRQEGEAMLGNTGVYVCTVCGFVYVGDAPPQLCPVCKVPAWKFEKVEGRKG